MARRARKESNTGFYHVLMRGNNKNWIFEKDKYKSLMRNTILKQEDSKLVEIYAWCIMDNHVHLVLLAEKDNLSEALFNINRSFAMKYNKANRMVGHVFENRFKSECVEDDVYLKQVIRYVHNNPVKAKMVYSPELYKWSSYNDYIALKYQHQSVNIIDSYFTESLAEFIEYHHIEEYDEYLELKEDRDKFREEQAQKVISKYCEKYQIISIMTIPENEELRSKIILEIKDKSHLPLRRIGEIMGMSYSRINRICQKMP